MPPAGPYPNPYPPEEDEHLEELAAQAEEAKSQRHIPNNSGIHNMEFDKTKGIRSTNLAH